MNAEAKIERKQFAPGWYKDLSNEEYHGSSGYSSSVLKMINEMPYSKMQYKRSHPEPPSDAMQMGTAVHTLALEPEKFEQEYAVRPDGLRKPTEAQLNAKKPADKTLAQIEDWLVWEKEKEGKTELTYEAAEQAKAMAQSLRDHPQIGLYLDERLQGVAEQSVFYWYNPEDWDINNDYRIMCKIRPDWIVPGHPIVFDLKTARDATETEFAKQIRKLSYHLSAAMYLDGSNRCKEFRDAMGVDRFEEFVWILVENEPPYECRSFSLSNRDFEDGGILYHSAVRRLHQYKQSAWKGYGQFDGKEFQPITTPIESPNWGNKIV